MMFAKLSSNAYDPNLGAWVDRPLGTIEINDRGVASVTGQVSPLLLRRVLMDPETGEKITLTSDPTRWLELLSTVYETSDLFVEPPDSRQEARQLDTVTLDERTVRV